MSPSSVVASSLQTLALLLARQSRVRPERIVVIEPAPPTAPSSGAPIGLRGFRHRAWQSRTPHAAGCVAPTGGGAHRCLRAHARVA